jgi:hypothetical protein
MQLEMVAEAFEKRYHMSFDELVEGARWARAARLRHEKITSGGIASLVGIIITAIAMAMWEGVKSWARR